jgi:hypothetical protein
VPWVVLSELHYGALRAQRREAQLALICHCPGGFARDRVLN